MAHFNALKTNSADKLFLKTPAIGLCPIRRRTALSFRIRAVFLCGALPQTTPGLFAAEWM
jgi:hypothetical protein